MKKSFLTVPILYIEDDITDQMFLKKALAELKIPYDLIIASNGEEALQILETLNPPPCIVISDINMPKMNGLELKRTIENDKELKQKSIPFIFFSNSASPEEIEEAFDMSTQGYFEKPQTYVIYKKIIGLIVYYWELSQSKNNKSLNVKPEEIIKASAS